jgi:hypothetical protein
MEILSFENSAQPARKKKSLGLILGVAVVAGVMTLGSTLASSVTITGGAITFGQGVVQAAACDSEISITPATGFTNATGAGSFKLGSITLGGLADACDDKKLIIKAYNDVNGSSPLTLVGTSTSISATYDKDTPTSSTILPGSSAVTLTGSTASANNGTLILTIATPILDATSISKLTIEQQN